MDEHVEPATQHRAQFFTGESPLLLESLVWN
jgi:hypothetical protein